MRSLTLCEIRKNRGLKEETEFFDLILVGILTTPILSFAVLGVLVILRIRGL